MQFLEMVFENLKSWREQWREEKGPFVFNIFLLCCTIIGLAGKYLISQTLNLTSDTVQSGIMAMEIFVHHNFFLKNFYLPATNPYYFTDTIPFQIIPQLISQYNPAVLKGIAFFVFSLTILIFGILIYKISKHGTNALIFAAIVSNMTALPYATIYDIPTSHMATALFIGIILLLLFDFPDVKSSNYAITLVLLAFIAYSDSIMLPWLVAPGLIYSLYFYRKRLKAVLSAIPSSPDSMMHPWLVAPGLIYYLYFYRRKLTAFWFVCLSILVIGVVTYVKMNYIPELVPSYLPDRLLPLQTIQSNFLQFMNGMASLYHESLSYFIQGSVQLTLIDLSSMIVSLGLLFYAFIILYKNIPEKFLLFFIGSGLAILGIYVFTNIALMGFWTTRYLSFFALLLFAAISLSYRETDKIFLSLLVLSLVFTGYSNISYLEKVHSSPNQQNYQLIEYLKSNQLTFGFGDFWDANVNTYLSREEVIIRPVFLFRGQITPYKWHASIDWYNISSVQKYFIAVREDGIKLNTKSMATYLPYHSPIQVLQFNTYDIYVFEGEPPMVNRIIYYQVGHLIKSNHIFLVHVSKSDGQGYALFGPYEQLSKGRYAVEFNISLADQGNTKMTSSNTSFCRMSVVSNNGQKVFAEKEVSPGDLLQKNGTSLDFTLQESEKNLEFRVWSEGVASFIVEAEPHVSRVYS